MVDLRNGDCFEILRDLPDNSIDLILTDPPYGTINGLVTPGWKNNGTRIRWDNALSPVDIFTESARLLRPNGRLILFSQDPYTCALITNAIPSLPFNYRAIWLKNNPGNPLMAKKACLSYYEDILLFSKIHPKHDFNGVHPLRSYSKKIYDFIGLSKKELISRVGQRLDHFFRFNSSQFTLCTRETYEDLIAEFSVSKMDGFLPYEKLKSIDDEYRSGLIEKMNTQYPSVFNLQNGEKSKSNVFEYAKETTSFHPTQKPVALLEDLILTFSNPGETVLDFTMGSGGTGVASVNTGRNFVGIELDERYFEIASRRIDGIKEVLV